MTPGEPSRPAVDDITKDSCTLSWHVPSTDGGTPITGYHVERATGKGQRWIRITRDAVKETVYDVRELVEGNEYQFRIIAENAVGVGSAGPPSENVLAQDPWGELTCRIKPEEFYILSLFHS